MHLLVYDGVCGLCHRVVQFVLARDHGRVFRFASLQSPVGLAVASRVAGHAGALTTLLVVANYRTGGATELTRSRAVLFIGRALGWPWKAAALLGVLPTSWLDRAYDLVARHRYRVFGKYERCQTPPVDYRDRFIDT